MRPETCYGTESNRATSSGCGPRRRHTTVRGCGIPAAVADTSRRCPESRTSPSAAPAGHSARIARREPQVPRGREDEAALTADLAELVRQCGAVLVCGSRQSDGLHRTEFPMAERLRRELQRKTAGRASERRGHRRTEGGTDHHRELAPTLRHDAATGRAVTGCRPRRPSCQHRPLGRLRVPNRLPAKRPVEQKPTLHESGIWTTASEPIMAGASEEAEVAKPQTCPG